MPSRNDYDIKYGTQNLKQYFYFKSQYTYQSFSPTDAQLDILKNNCIFALKLTLNANLKFF